MESFTRLYQFLCCVTQQQYPTPYNFIFKPEEEPLNILQFESNYVKTSKYTWYDFFIKAIILQYNRIANIYFLIIGILSSIPAISPVSSITIWIPIAIVLTISLIRQGYQDYKRHIIDEQLNHKMKALTYQNNTFIQKEWSQLRVGHIVKVLQNEFFPADLILISSSQPSGNAFIQTSSLDGQKSLKIRKGYSRTNKYNCEQLLANFEGEWFGIQPDKDLHRFSSKLKIEHNIIEYEGDKQFLYRGAKLKNTKWVYGMVIYTGKNTKIMMNLNVSRSKISKLEQKLNYLLTFIFLFQVLICIFPAVLYGVYRQKEQSVHNYIDWPVYKIEEDSVLMFFSYIILMSTFIPISLVISIEFVKVFQGYFINSDKLMYSQQRKQGVTANAISLNEQLGQIQYVLTDKTGTLTKNVMEFKIALIGNYIYGDEQLIRKCGFYASQQILKSNQILNIASNSKNIQLQDKIRLKNGSLKGDFQIGTLHSLIQEYFQLISMTHEVLLETTQTNEKIYVGPSPDEISLVDFAKSNRFEFVNATQSQISIKILQKMNSFQLLQTFSFTSQRKRMSIIFRDFQGNIRIYIKGADNIIKQRLAVNQVLNLDQKINKCSSIGLRTLLLATRIIPQRQYLEFKKRVSQLDGKEKQIKHQQLISQIEQQLVLLGGTAVLDKLQDLVPQTIKDFLKANIKVWMLTGDKLETAQNIAISCNLIQKHFHIFRLSTDEIRSVQELIKKIEVESQENLNRQIKSVLIIEGTILTQIAGNQELQQILLNILLRCQSVICCRLLPLQKAQIVKLLRSRTDKIVLSIGDGQNDVPMIRQANIGIGLFGQEGMGAVQASDYGLPQFRMLRRLLFVHGRWNYIRISDMILYFFYKNIIFTIPRLVFGFYSMFSCQRIFDDVYVALYNAVFTAVPLVIRAVLEQDVNYVFSSKLRSNGELFQQIEEQLSNKDRKSSVLQDHPECQYLPQGYYINKYFYKIFPKIYFTGKENCIFNVKNFLFWVTEAIIIGVLLTVFALIIFGGGSINQQGWNGDLWLVSLNLFTGLMIVVTLKLVLHTKYWSLLLVISILFVSIGLYIAYMWFSNYVAILSNNILGTNMILWHNYKSLFYQIFCLCLILFIDGIIVTINFDFGSYASKMRLAVSNEQQYNKNYLKLLNLPISESSSGCREMKNKNYMVQDVY